MTDIFQKRILVPSTLATWCKRSTHWKRPWCWEKTGEEGGDRGWDWSDGIVNSVDMSLSKLWEMVEDGEAWRVRYDGETEQQWLERTWSLSQKLGRGWNLTSLSSRWITLFLVLSALQISSPAKGYSAHPFCSRGGARLLQTCLGAGDSTVKQACGNLSSLTGDQACAPYIRSKS